MFHVDLRKSREITRAVHLPLTISASVEDHYRLKGTACQKELSRVKLLKDVAEE